jgi:hypothetical protein
MLLGLSAGVLHTHEFERIGASVFASDLSIEQLASSVKVSRRNGQLINVWQAEVQATTTDTSLEQSGTHPELPRRQAGVGHQPVAERERLASLQRDALLVRALALRAPGTQLRLLPHLPHSLHFLATDNHTSAHMHAGSRIEAHTAPPTPQRATEGHAAAAAARRAPAR